MKTINSSVVAKISAALSVACLFGASLHAQPNAMVAKVPFAFVATGRTMPAGSYLFQDAANQTATFIRNIGTGKAIYVAASEAGGESRSERPCVRFHRYGSEFFLAEVWSSSGVSRHVPVCRRERELRLSPKTIEAMVLVTIPIRAD